MVTSQSQPIGYYGYLSESNMVTTDFGRYLPSILEALEADLLRPLVDKSSVEPFTGVRAPALALA